MISFSMTLTGLIYYDFMDADALPSEEPGTSWWVHLSPSGDMKYNYLTNFLIRVIECTIDYRETILNG